MYEMVKLKNQSYFSIWANVCVQVCVCVCACAYLRMFVCVRFTWKIYFVKKGFAQS